NISYIIDHTLYGLNPTGWHLTNILLHALATILLYHLIRRLITLTPPPTPAYTNLAALAGAAFWAVHPVQTEVVAWIKSRDDLMATAFFFATLLVALPRYNVKRRTYNVESEKQYGEGTGTKLRSTF